MYSRIIKKVKGLKRSLAKHRWNGIELLSGTIVLLIVVSSCKKYEEGPGVSLRSKQTRVVGEWLQTNEVEGDTSSISLYLFNSIHIQDDGGFSADGNTGSWAFNHNKTELIVTLDNSIYPSSNVFKYDISRLSNKELYVGAKFISDSESSVKQQYYKQP